MVGPGERAHGILVCPSDDFILVPTTTDYRTRQRNCGNEIPVFRDMELVRLSLIPVSRDMQLVRLSVFLVTSRFSMTNLPQLPLATCLPKIKKKDYFLLVACL